MIYNIIYVNIVKLPFISAWLHDTEKRVVKSNLIIFNALKWILQKH